jgi:hypothetical protein
MDEVIRREINRAAIEAGARDAALVTALLSQHATTSGNDLRIDGHGLPQAIVDLRSRRPDLFSAPATNTRHAANQSLQRAANTAGAIDSALVAAMLEKRAEVRHSRDGAEVTVDGLDVDSAMRKLRETRADLFIPTGAKPGQPYHVPTGLSSAQYRDLRKNSPHLLGLRQRGR